MMEGGPNFLDRGAARRRINARKKSEVMVKGRRRKGRQYLPLAHSASICAAELLQFVSAKLSFEVACASVRITQLSHGNVQR